MYLFLLSFVKNPVFDSCRVRCDAAEAALHRASRSGVQAILPIYADTMLARDESRLEGNPVAKQKSEELYSIYNKEYLYRVSHQKDLIRHSSHALLSCHFHLYQRLPLEHPLPNLLNNILPIMLAHQDNTSPPSPHPANTAQSMDEVDTGVWYIV